MRERNRFLGSFSENLISNFLESKGHQILKLRFKSGYHEIDVISIFGQNIIFTEVKYRDHFDDFEGIVDENKMGRIFEAAQDFIIKNSYDNLNYQFDIIFLDKSLNIHHIENISI